MIALPPVEIANAPRKAARPHSGSLPTFGYWNRDGAIRALNFLLAAVKLTGTQHLFRLLIGERSEWPAFSVRHANIVSKPFDAASDFIDALDVLIVPESDDRAVEQVAIALRNNKMVIAPDAGTITEILRFGRNGVLFKAENSYDLARSINNVTASWKKPPFNFEAGESAILPTSPSEVARTFARMYRKLSDRNLALNGSVVR
jgi:hypothetical protein